MVKQEQLLILRRFPFLEPKCHRFCCYKGYISAGTDQFHVALKVPHYPSQHNLQVKCCSRMQRLLGAKVPPLGDSLFESLCNLQQALESALSSNEAIDVALPSLARLRTVADDLSALTAVQIVSATAALDRVVLGCQDSTGHLHRLPLCKQGAAFALVASPDLPPPPLTHSGSGSLSSWALPWRERIDSLQVLWERLAEVDSACWVTDPYPATFAHTHRRIALGVSVWGQITLNPERPWDRPDVKLFGPEEKLKPFAASLQLFVADDDWDPQAPLPVSLLSMLGMEEFPARPDSSPGGNDLAPSPLVAASECAICFELHDQSGALSEEGCQSDTCHAHFHATCLFQWLDALRCQTDFCRIRGACPNCDAPISCPAM